MNNKMSLIDIDFKKFPIEEKRKAFFLMDVTMKRLHENNLMVTDFRPSQVYCENGFYFFEKVSPISDYYVDNKDKAIFRNVLGLSNLAFCSYLPEYNLNNGLLSYDVINQQYNNFAGYFPEEDASYYKSVFVDSYNNKKLISDVVYFSDYVVKQSKDTPKSNVSSLAYIKSTEAGRAFARQDDNEAAFGSKFFLLTVVASFTVLLAGVVLLLFKYFV